MDARVRDVQFSERTRGLPGKAETRAAAEIKGKEEEKEEEENGGFGKKVTMRDAKEKKDYCNNNGKTKKKKTATTEAKEAVCPLWNVTYSEQLKRKKAKVKKALAMVTEMVGKTNEKFKKSTRHHHHQNHHRRRHRHRDGVGGDEDERATSERFGWLKEANAKKSKDVAS